MHKHPHQGETTNQMEIQNIHAMFYQQIRFQEIDHIVGQLPQQLYNQIGQQSFRYPPKQQHNDRINLQFLLIDNCLIITQKSFNRHYKYLLSQLTSQKITFHSIKCGDILISMNGENQRVWNTKKSLLLKKQQSEKLNIEHELALNQAVLMKFKKSNACYQFRYQLIQKLLVGQILQKQDHQGQIQKVLERERALSYKILKRFYRNYFCWVYWLKINKLYYHQILPIHIINHCQSANTIMALACRMYQQLIQQLHKCIENNPNDHSALHYLRWITNDIQPIESHLTNLSPVDPQQLQEFKGIRSPYHQLQWISKFIEFCEVAYPAEESYRQAQLYYQEVDIKSKQN